MLENQVLHSKIIPNLVKPVPKGLDFKKRKNFAKQEKIQQMECAGFIGKNPFGPYVGKEDARS